MGHRQKMNFYRWIGLAVGLIIGMLAGFFYYSWSKKEEVVHFQKNIGEVKLQTELQKWQMKNPRQAVALSTNIYKELGIYEELRDETNSERIQQRIMQRIQEMTEKEQEEFGEKVIEVYEKNAPSFLEKLKKFFPWYLQYNWLIIIFLVLASSGIFFLLGYLSEPTEEVKY